MSKDNKPLKVLFSTVLGILLVGLVVGAVATQAAVAGPPPKMNQTRLLQMEQTARLIASDGAKDDAFGWSVAVDGDTIAVGATGDETGRGSVYVFVKPEGGWRGTLTETARLVPSGGANYSQFGYSVAVNGSTIIVGAIHDNSNKGVAYIFVKPAGGWQGILTETARLTASDGAEWDSFGTAVALSRDTAIVSASDAEVGGKIRQGAAYVFTQPAGGWAGTLTETAKLVASDSGGAGDFFGVSAGISGNTIVSGAAFHNSNQGRCTFLPNPPAAGTGP